MTVYTKKNKYLTKLTFIINNLYSNITFIPYHFHSKTF